MQVLWTEEEFERAKTLWQQGQSARSIGIELHKTKNAVLARLHRANAHHRDVEPEYLRHYHKPNNSQRKHPVERPALLTQIEAAPIATPFIPTEPEPPAKGITIRYLRRNSCRYPLSDDPRTTSPSKFLYCGAKITHGAYCEAHAQLAYVPLRGGARSAEREAMARMVQQIKPTDLRLLDKDVA